ncbi:MAG: glycerol-3-phosphate dehydrogenase [Rickettsiales bacterium]|nr:glycerol-3-phosphate dehydrogenase [Rickettsiales bacterium]OUV54040.1 MAG: glycerol-3-phosphate dehydrogenase [Rickettsiales bacterium TMED127]|tara:strand:+ start:26153 stop:27496 length:1344 start_codon:yes stop_codon:yes gene_type:complete
MSNKEGGLSAPIRHAIDWKNPDFYNEEILDEELRRVFDICHGCRRCFNLCESFPKLFDFIDESDSGELDSVNSKDFKEVVDACTLCDMCYMTKCPYVPPHEFNLDFPHLMLRYRAMERNKKKNSLVDDQLKETDRNGKFFSKFSKVVNWSTSNKNKLTRPVMEKFLKIDKEAELPKYYGNTFKNSSIPQPKKKDFKDKVALFPTCFVNYNNPGIGEIVLKLFEKLNVNSKIFYEGCCGMPQLESGDIDAVSRKATSISLAAKSLIDEGYKIISVVPSCTLMLKYEWPLILPNDKHVKLLSENTLDICEYVVNYFRTNDVESVIPEWTSDDGVTIHISCHSRAQNIGQKAAEMLKIIPSLKVDVIERCSGHGGAWGIKKNNFEMALKVGKPVARKVVSYKNKILVSECPLAGVHIKQGIEKIDKNFKQTVYGHPIEIIAKALGIQSET